MNRSRQLVINVILFATIMGLALWVGYQYLDPFTRKNTVALIPYRLTLFLISGALYAYFHKVIHGSVGLGFLEGKLVKAKQIDVRFKDVIGLGQVIVEAQEVVQLVRDRIQSKQKGGHIIRGLLMLGPPGCGKTMIAKAIATEAGLPFLALSGSDFVEKWYSLGAMRIRGLFREARYLAKDRGACVVFIDELEVIGRRRNFGAQQGEAETGRTLTQLLVEMDGLGESGHSNIIVIGATNATEDVLDPALLRPGRFDRKLYVDRPSRDGRKDLFDFYLLKVKAKDAIDTATLAFLTDGKSPADIENIVREAALLAAKAKKTALDFSDLLMAIEKLDLGLRIPHPLKPKERQSMAYHEAAHLLAATYYQPLDEVIRVSIAPRRGRLSVTQQIPRQESFSYSREDYLNKIRILLAGYVSERMIFDHTTEVVQQDFDAATRIVQLMVWQIGMGESGLIGNYDAIKADHLSNALKQTLNHDMEKIFRQSVADVEKMLRKHRSILDQVAAQLVEKEELERSEIRRLTQPILTERGVA